MVITPLFHGEEGLKARAPETANPVTGDGLPPEDMFRYSSMRKKILVLSTICPFSEPGQVLNMGTFLVV